MASLKVKHAGDVKMIISVTRPSSHLGAPGIEILTKGPITKLYGDVDTLADDYDERTNVYKQAMHIWEYEGYTDPVEVISVDETISRHNPGNITVTKDGKVTATDEVETPVITAIKSHLYDGAKYLLLDDSFTLDEIQNLSDFLYDQQRLFLVAPLKTEKDLQTLGNHVREYQADPTYPSNVAGFLVEEGNYAIDNAAAYAAANVPVDWQHIGNLSDTLSELVPIDGLTVDDYETIDELRGITVVNKADNDMLLNGKALGANYIDQFVHVNLVGDGIEKGIQLWLNSHKFPNYDDDSISQIRKTIQAVCDDFVSQGVLEKMPSGKSVEITVPERDRVSQSDINARKLKNIKAKVKVADDIDSVELALNVTL